MTITTVYNILYIFELILNSNYPCYTVQQHYVDDTTTKNLDQDKARPPNTPGAREAEDDIEQQTHTGERNKDLDNKCKVATKQHRGVHQDTLHQPQNTNYLRDTGDNTTHMP